MPYHPTGRPPGRPKRQPVPLPTDFARFWGKVAVRGPDDCWLWTRHTGTHGYGVFGCWDGKCRTAPSVAFFFAHGHFPREGSMHLCDDRYPVDSIAYRLCCNPAHLKDAGERENARRMVALGRGRGFFSRRHAT
jgi:hypothetical protein